ncbi:Sentrin-specific protease 7 [Trachymyrmex cornetzi]|uniref:Sentrin-specific protease 7 n=1 Tax=Trachymyrmex cornetzi TaxID=471704 RepID=A0A195DTR0_9HYME|nr:Sentrin-specific protease 7 [Trachymyrmex cornetzi]
MYEDPNFLIDTGLLPQIALECRTVRIGSYKYIPQEKVVICRNGVKLHVPSLENDSSFVTFDVKYEDIIKFFVHFGKAMPVIFFYISARTGTMIHELLGMQDLVGLHDPSGKNLVHKYITLLPNKFPENSKTILTSLFSRENKMVEITPQKANDLLQRTAPKDNLLQFITIQEEKPSQNLVNDIDVGNDDTQIIVIYPPSPAKGGIAINTEHYLCLAEDNFLNDVIIDFYLKYLTLEVLSEFDQQRTHVFNSFFYKRLTSSYVQDAQNTVSMTLAARRHARVQTWTKDVNIFEKDFIIIPINKDAHWFLAIICFPGLVEKISTCTAKTRGNDNNKTVQKTKKIKELKKTITIDFTTIPPASIITIDNESERNKAEDNDDKIKIEIDKKNKTDQSKKNATQINVELEKQKEIIKKPCILIFDSLPGENRTRIIATLRDYLSCEHVAKLGVKKIFSEDTIKGEFLKVPRQSNFADCGLYVLQYVESFFKDPIKDYTLPIKTLKKWFEEIIITRKREEISNLLIKLMNNTKGNETSIDLPTINFPKQDGKLKSKVKNRTDIKTAELESKNNKRFTSDTNLLGQLTCSFLIL